jgi:cobalt-zinc-cadmium efflux system protein
MKHHNFHIRKSGSIEKSIIYVILVLLVFILLELYGAYISNSLALLSDAGHLATDALALLVAYFGFLIGRKKPTEQYSYGYTRSEVIAAGINAVAWFVLFGFIIYESIVRLIHVEQVDPLLMLPIAVLGLIVNLVIFKILHKDDHKHNINMRGAILHVLMDILGSVAAIIGGIIIYFTDWYYVDPIISVALASLILRSGFYLLKDTLRILMEGKPGNIDETDIKNSLMSNISDVKDVHHIHIWEITSGQVAATMHITILDDGSCNSTIWNAKRILREQFGIIHTTIQVEHNVCPDEELFYDI